MLEIQAREPSPDAKNTTEFKFVYVEHKGWENEIELLREIADCDVILMEEVGYFEEEKASCERDIFLATREPDTPAGAQSRHRLFSDQHRAWGNFVIQMAIDSGKEFHFVDVRCDSLAMNLSRSWKRLYDHSFKLFNKGEYERAANLLEIAIDVFSKSNGLRSETVVSQIQEMKAEAGGKWIGKKIAVIQGAGHSETYDIFKRALSEDKNIKISKLDAKKPLPGMMNLVKLKEKNPSIQLSRTDIIKQFFCIGMIFPFLHVTKKDSDDENMYLRADRITDSLTTAEVDWFWQMLKSAGEKNATKTQWRIAWAITKKYSSEKPRLNV